MVSYRTKICDSSSYIFTSYGASLQISPWVVKTTHTYMCVHAFMSTLKNINIILTLKNEELNSNFIANRVTCLAYIYTNIYTNG
jgi:hypothetical protein